MIELKSAAEIGRMRVTGEFVASVLAELSSLAAPGVNLLDLEQRAREMVSDRGAVSCYWDYSPSFGRGPFRNVICLSVNDAVLHGLPHDYVLADGDLLSMDFAVSIDGWVADSAVSVIVGTPDPEDVRLIDTTRAASMPPLARPDRVIGSAISRRPWPPSQRAPGTGSTPTSEGTAWAAPCTRIPTYPTRGRPVGG
ncbi:Probable methionine aminopeptidase%2C type I (MAP) [Mycobacteroides abscessus]|nr:Probable methionine aminopeptidase%2C type I (MAP) [Mycobacteroides abscessus]